MSDPDELYLHSLQVQLDGAIFERQAREGLERQRAYGEAQQAHWRVMDAQREAAEAKRQLAETKERQESLVSAVLLQSNLNQITFALIQVIADHRAAHTAEILARTVLTRHITGTAFDPENVASQWVKLPLLDLAEQVARMPNGRSTPGWLLLAARSISQNTSCWPGSELPRLSHEAGANRETALRCLMALLADEPLDDWLNSAETAVSLARSSKDFGAGVIDLGLYAIMHAVALKCEEAALRLGVTDCLSDLYVNFARAQLSPQIGQHTGQCNNRDNSKASLGIDSMLNLQSRLEEIEGHATQPATTSSLLKHWAHETVYALIYYPVPGDADYKSFVKLIGLRHFFESTKRGVKLGVENHRANATKELANHHLTTMPMTFVDQAFLDAHWHLVSEAYDAKRVARLGSHKHSKKALEEIASSGNAVLDAWCKAHPSQITTQMSFDVTSSSQWVPTSKVRESIPLQFSGPESSIVAAKTCIEEKVRAISRSVREKSWLRVFSKSALAFALIGTYLLLGEIVRSVGMYWYWGSLVLAFALWKALAPRNRKAEASKFRRLIHIFAIGFGVLIGAVLFNWLVFNNILFAIGLYRIGVILGGFYAVWAYVGNWWRVTSPLSLYPMDKRDATLKDVASSWQAWHEQLTKKLRYPQQFLDRFREPRPTTKRA